MNKVAIVTGASSGIGKAVCERYLSEGVSVIGIDLNNGIIENKLYNHISVNIADYQEVKKKIDGMVTDKIDYLVNCAGITLIGNLENTSCEDFDLQIDVNLKGTFNICKACIEYMKNNRGSAIVNIASDLGVKPVADRCAYVAAKAGVIKLTEAIAIDYGPNVRANSIQPGIVDTPMVQGRFEENPELKEIYGSFYLLERIANANEIVEGVMFLTKDSSSFVTGISLPIAGGSNLK